MTTGRISFGLLFLLSTVGSTPGTDSDEQGECVRLDHQCNAVFNRSANEEYFKFPNTRGMMMEASQQEFLDFVPFLIKNCSLKLWTLLCFRYFPQCYPELPLRYAVTPCRARDVRRGEKELLRDNGILQHELVGTHGMLQVQLFF